MPPRYVSSPQSRICSQGGTVRTGGWSWIWQSRHKQVLDRSAEHEVLKSSSASLCVSAAGDCDLKPKLWQQEADSSLATVWHLHYTLISVLREDRRDRKLSGAGSWRAKPELLIHILLSVCSQADLRPTCHPAWPSHPFCVYRGLSS